VGVSVAGAGVRVLSRIAVFTAGRNVEYELRALLLDRLQRLGPAFFRKMPTGDIMSRATNDLVQVRLLLGFGILNIVGSSFALISAFFVMFSSSWKLTLAAMINHVNESEYGHILAIEDPIEFLHESKKCLINQREVGPHTLSFSNALRSALREDPDAILVGEMRDLETIRLALTAAETGHLVFGTLHTSSAAKTVDRIVDVFPAAEKEMVRAMLSESLVAVISQTLCKLKDGSGRVAAHEIMLGTSAIRNLIREAKVAQMYSSIQTGQGAGMQTLDQNLTELVRRNTISAAEARGKAKIPENFPG
jgi:Tfp pilus assembly pilus retraction ATPase PilT